MSISNRAAKLTRFHRVLKKHYKPVTPVERPLLEHLLYACCLEAAGHDAADQAFARLEEVYFDWNEVRVTTISELSDVMRGLPDASAAAGRLKRTLQSVFETYYAFELESFKKENIGQAVKKLQQLDGVTPFVIAYATQNGLGGHAIAVNAGALETLRIIGAISDKEASEGKVPGLERAIPKTKGIEFASLLHQIGIDYAAARFSPRVRAILVEVDPDAKQRLPKRARRPKAGAEKTSKKSVKPKSKSPSANGSKGETKQGRPTKKTRKAKATKTEAPKPKKTAKKTAKKSTTTRKQSGRSAAKKSPTKRLTRKKPR